MLLGSIRNRVTRNTGMDKNREMKKKFYVQTVEASWLISLGIGLKYFTLYAVKWSAASPTLYNTKVQFKIISRVQTQPSSCISFKIFFSNHKFRYICWTSKNRASNMRWMDRCWGINRLPVPVYPSIKLHPVYIFVLEFKTASWKLNDWKYLTYF